MVINKAAQEAPQTQGTRTQTFRQVVTQPVFPGLSGTVRPYLLALLLFAAAAVLMSAGDAALLRYGLSWPLVSLLVIAASASL